MSNVMQCNVMLQYHSVYVGVDGGDNDYFVTLYASRPDSNNAAPMPFNVAADLTQAEANELGSILERIGDRLCLDDLLG